VLGLGTAGAGYLIQRADLAAAGSAVTVTGLAAERFGNRDTRRRMRRQRQENRAELLAAQQLTRDVTRELSQAQLALDELRARVGALSLRLAAQETTAEEEPSTDPTDVPDPVGLSRAAGSEAAAIGTPPTGLPSAEIDSTGGVTYRTWELRPVHPGPAVPADRPLPQDPAAGYPQRPAATAAPRPSVTEGIPGPATAAPRRGATPRPSRPAAAVVTSDWFTPEPPTRDIPRIRSGAGIFADLQLPRPLPGLPPGPRDPISGSIPLLVDTASDRDGTSTREETDALVYAALEAVDVDELTRVLESRDGRPEVAGPRNRLVSPESGADGRLVVAGAHTAGDSTALPVRGRHSA
jgi:hypothetical protein